MWKCFSEIPALEEAKDCCKWEASLDCVPRSCLQNKKKMRRRRKKKRKGRKEAVKRKKGKEGGRKVGRKEGK